MKIFKIITISFVGLAVLMCTGASADQPATRPATSSYSNSQFRRTLRALVVGKTAGVRPATPQEWDEMMVFMQKYSPARALVLESIPLNHETSPIALEAIRRWRNYVFTNEHFPAITDDLVRRFQLEDDLFELTLRDRADEGGEALELRDKIQAKVGQIVELEFQERQARIDRLQTIIADEKSRLQHDQSSEDDIIDRRTDTIIRSLEKLNPNLAPPTTRPEDTSSTDEMPPTTAHQGLMNVPDPAILPAK
jgi:hypothetical protein